MTLISSNPSPFSANDGFISTCFTDAVNDVIGTMAGFKMKEIKDHRKFYFESQISGVMLLLGQNNAVINITMSKQSAGLIIAYMTGILPFDLADEDLYDGVAELVNIIAGRAKALLLGTEYYFDLTPPFTINGSNFHIIHKNKISKIFAKYSAGEIEFYLEVFYI